MKINRSGQANPLSRDDFYRLIDAMNRRDRAIAALCWYTTERPGAILKLPITSVIGTNGAITETIVFAARTRKQRRTHEVPVCRSLARELTLYNPDPANYWLFPGKHGDRPIHYTTWDRACRYYFAAMGLKGYSTYSFRRGALTTLAETGISLRRIQEISGHSSLESLQRYLDCDPVQVKKAIEIL